MKARLAWIFRQLRRPQIRAVFAVSDSQLASVIAARLEVPPRWSGMAPSRSLVSGYVSTRPPYQVDLRPYLEGEVFGFLAPPGTSSQIVRPHLKGSIEADGNGSSALIYRVDQFATALATLVFSGAAVVLIIGGLIGHFLGGTQWSELGLVIAFIGALIAGWPVSFMIRFGMVIRYEQSLTQWIGDLGGSSA
jgi:hypothetical protein